MPYTVTAGEMTTINLAPETLHEEVMQNVAMIISTPQFSVPLDRGFGLEQRFLDKLPSIALTIAISEVMDAIQKYEPRAEIINITLIKGNKEGSFIPMVELEVKPDGG